MTAAAVCLAMTVTRTETLVFSHRYIGAASVYLYLALAVVGAALAATVLDSYAQHLVRYPENFGRPLLFPKTQLQQYDLKGDDNTSAYAGAAGCFHYIWGL